MTEFTPEWIAKARNACILFGEPATTEFIKALDYIERLQKRVEELEATISNQSALVYKFKNMASDLQSENDFLKNNPEAEKYYYQKWVEGKQRIAELEQERRWIHQDKTMIAKKDGDSWCFVLPDFVNLHESEAEFVDGILYRFIEEIYKRLLPPQDGE